MKRGGNFTSLSWKAPTYGPKQGWVDSRCESVGLRGRKSWNFPQRVPSARCPRARP